MHGKISFDDNKVIACVAKGDVHAFEQLFNRYYSGLLRYAKAMLPYPSDEAEDIISELFCDLWRNRDQLIIQSSLAAYLYTAVKNRILNFQKKTRLLVDGEESGLTEVADSAYQMPDQLLMYKETSQRLAYLIGKLPERSRLVFLMNRDEGLSYQEIAGILDISVNSVKTHMFRSLRFLKSAFRHAKG